MFFKQTSSSPREIGLAASMLIGTTLSAGATTVSLPPQNIPGWSLGSSYVGYLSDNFGMQTPITNIGTQTVATTNISNIGNEGSQSTTSIVTLGSDPSVTLTGTATATNIPGNNTVAEASGLITLTYYFSLLNAPAGAEIPLTVSAFYTTIGSSASAALEIHGANTQLGDIQESSDGGQWQPITTDFLAQTIYTVEITVEGEAAASSINQNTFTNSFTAMVDPTITFASGFDNVNGYSIDFSDGVTDAVPEPSTWAMLLIGFAGIGFAVCRRRRHTPSAADHLTLQDPARTVFQPRAH